MPELSPIQSADRLFTVMELLSYHPKGISLSDLSFACNLPKGTVSRLLAALIANGYATQVPGSHQYRLTMRMFEVGSRVADQANLLSAARPYLEALAQHTGETVHLVTRIKDEVVYLYKEEGGSSVVRMASSVGLHSPMYCTGVGKSILAYLPEDEIRAIWERNEIVKFADNTITVLEDMLTEAARIRQCGYALDLEEHEPGVCCIAAPILNLSGNPIASISLAAPKTRMDDARIEALAPCVVETARKISKAY